MKLTFPLFWDGEKLSQSHTDGSQSPTSLNSSSSNTANPSFTLAPLSLTRSSPLYQLKLPSINEVLLQSRPLSYYSPPCSESTSRSGNAMDWKPLGMPKRPRRRFHEVERKFPCTHPGCDKAYGALNHLNAHIVSRGHGIRRKAREFITSELGNYSPASSLYSNNNAKGELSFITSTYSPTQ